MGETYLWVLTWEVFGQMGISKQGMVLLKYASLSNLGLKLHSVLHSFYLT
jgi:hypothetical protein